MNVTYTCPRCEGSCTSEVDPDASSLRCADCQLELARPEDAFRDGQPERCLICPSTDLFVRKDFPQRLGVAIVVLGFAVSCVTWNLYLTNWTFAVLFATALIDLVLFAVVGESVTCYRCGAQYRGVAGLKDRRGFDLEVHERYRQEAARLVEQKTPVGRTSGPSSHAPARRPADDGLEVRPTSSSQRADAARP